MKCIYCGKEFEPQVAWRRYCSRSCGEKYRRIHKEGIMYESITFNCTHCGKLVVTDGKKDKRTRFCCASCEKKFWRHPHWDSPSNRINFRSVKEYEAYERRTNEV